MSFLPLSPSRARSLFFLLPPRQHTHLPPAGTQYRLDRPGALALVFRGAAAPALGPPSPRLISVAVTAVVVVIRFLIEQGLPRELVVAVRDLLRAGPEGAPGAAHGLGGGAVAGGGVGGVLVRRRGVGRGGWRRHRDREVVRGSPGEFLLLLL